MDGERCRSGGVGRVDGEPVAPVCRVGAWLRGWLVHTCTCTHVLAFPSSSLLRLPQPPNLPAGISPLLFTPPCPLLFTSPPPLTPPPRCSPLSQTFSLLAVLGGLHLAAITDLAWAPDALTLAASSRWVREVFPHTRSTYIHTFISTFSPHFSGSIHTLIPHNIPLPQGWLLLPRGVLSGRAWDAVQQARAHRRRECRYGIDPCHRASHFACMKWQGSGKSRGGDDDQQA